MMKHLDKFERVGALYDVIKLEVFTQFNQSITCTAYILNEFYPKLLKFPMLKSYTKDHASSYVSRQERNNNEDISKK